MTSKLTEIQHQCKFFRWVRANLRENLIIYSNCNGGLRTKKGASILKHAGALAGIPDIFLACPSAGFNGLFIELKKKDGCRISKEQLSIIKTLRTFDYCAEVAFGWEEARDLVIEYLEL